MNIRSQALTRLIIECVVAFLYISGLIPFVYYSIFPLIFIGLIINLILSITTQKKGMTLIIINLVMCILSLIPLLGALFRIVGAILSIISAVMMYKVYKNQPPEIVKNPNEKLVAYMEKKMESYPLETLASALIKHGYPQKLVKDCVEYIQQKQTPSFVNDEKNTLLLYIGSIFLGFILPVIFVFSSTNKRLVQHAKNILNWQLSLYVYLVVAMILTYVYIGGILMMLLFVFNLVFLIKGGIDAGEKKIWKCPIAIPFFRLDDNV